MPLLERPDVAGGIELYRRALGRIEDLRARVELLIEQADALVFAGEFAEAIDAFERARELLDEAGVGTADGLRRGEIGRAHV